MPAALPDLQKIQYQLQHVFRCFQLREIPPPAKQHSGRFPKAALRFPGLRIEFDVDTGLSNLSTGDVDIAIRLAKPKSETLIGRRLTTIPLGLFRAQDYSLADKSEYPDLSGEQLLWLDHTLGPIPENIWLRDHGREDRSIVRSTSLRALEKACIAGLGIAPLPVYRGKELGLQVVPEPELPARQPWIVFHRDNRNNRRIRSVRNWIAACFKKEVGL